MIGTGLRNNRAGPMTDGVHDMGGCARLRKSGSRAERTAISRRLGAARICAHGRHGEARRLERRHVARRAREPAAQDYLAKSYTRSGSPGWKN